jgi:hypothetical protein
MKQPKSVSEALKMALKRISNPKNWGKGAFQHWEGRTPQFCAVGALIEVSHGTHFYRQGVEILQALVPHRKGEYRPLSIIGYNDAPRRTHAQIVRLYERAIKKALVLEKT